jgi:outer membrane protein OmpA-like peptidoglycan-associated protein
MKKFFAILFIWGLILGGAGTAYWALIWEPEPADPSKGNKPGPGGPVVVVPPGMKPINLALDSFSGYCVFRSEDFKKKLEAQKLFLNCVDDKADYKARMETIKKGETPYAVFTIDALINTTPTKGDPPATIVMLIDETRGADAMVAYETGVKTIDALNSPRAKVVLTPDSPSETLMRIVRSQFDLRNLPRDRKKYIIEANENGAADVYEKFLAGSQTEPTAYVLWEPYVSMALKVKGAKRLIDSSKFSGMIVDVLVVQTDYLNKHRDEVKAFVQAYLEVLHKVKSTESGMTHMVELDAEIIKEPNVKKNADDVVKGIWWKNTMENYHHFGVIPEDKRVGYMQPTEMIKNITDVLEQTKQDDEPSPKLPRPDKLWDAGILRDLYELKPRALNNDETITPIQTFVPVAAVSWKDLREVGSLKVKEVPFTTQGKLLPEAEEALADLALKLERWPKYYLRVEGNTLREGLREANMARAQKRAETVRDYLIETHHISPGRLQAQGNEPGGGKNVGFKFLEQP